MNTKMPWRLRLIRSGWPTGILAGLSVLFISWAGLSLIFCIPITIAIGVLAAVVDNHIEHKHNKRLAAETIKQLLETNRHD